MTYLESRREYARPQAVLWADQDAPKTAGVYNTPITPPGYEVNSNVEGSNFLILSDHNREDIGVKINRIGNTDRMVNGRMRSYFVADKRKVSITWKMLPSRSYSLDPNFRQGAFTITNAESNGTTIVFEAVNDLRPGELVAVSGVTDTDFNFTGKRVTASTPSTFTVMSDITAKTSTGGSATASEVVRPTGDFSDGESFQQFTVDGGAGGVDILNWYETHTGSFFVYLSYDKNSEFASNKYDHLNEYNEVLEMFISDFSYDVVKRGNAGHDFWDISVTLEEA